MATVLVIDDDQGIQRLVKAIFNRRTKHKVLAELSGQEGFDQAVAQLPDLIMLDLRLPDLDGLEVCRRLKAGAKTRHIPVIMVTGRGSQEDVVNAYKSGANDYIVKPFENNTLLHKVDKLLATARRGTPAAAVESAPA